MSSSQETPTNVRPNDQFNDVIVASIRRAVTLNLPQLVPHSIQEAEAHLQAVTAEQQQKLAQMSKR